MYKGTSYPVTTIDYYAFQGGSLTSVTIPNSVTTIMDSAFSSNNGLTSITIPNSVTYIGESAFTCCYNLSRITIPSSVKTICREAFRDCPRLTIYCEVESEPVPWNDNWNYDNCPVVWGYKEQ